MSRFFRLTALAVLLASGGSFSLAAGARAASVADSSNIYVDGRYHSETNGIANYDGFDQFRDARGNPLPGWEYELRSPG
jgi:hypothetical protein